MCSWASKDARCILVRSSRYAFSGLDESDAFTVNVPSLSLNGAIRFCGRHSGCDYDEFAACDATAQPSRTVSTPGIAECPVTYECRILRIDVVKGSLDPKLVSRAFPGEALFRPHYGEILAVRAAKNALKTMGL